MESSKQIWGAEGCSSSESGWTMYISSPTQEDDAGYSNENDEGIYGENRRQKRGPEVDEEESDDSMASDASSAPFHYRHAYAHSQNSQGTAVSKKDRKDGGSKRSSGKNANKLEKKHVDTRRKK